MTLRKPVELDGFSAGAAKGFILQASHLGEQMRVVRKELRECIAALLGWPKEDWQHYEVAVNQQDKIFFFDNRTHQAAPDGGFVEITKEESNDTK